jgi:transposase
MRIIGLDIHRTFAEAVMLDGDKLKRMGKIPMTREHLAAFAAKLTHEDHVVVEATGNAHATVAAMTPFVGRIVVANPLQVHLIAKARIKTDTIDATVLARLYASGFLPEVWVPDEHTLALRRLVARRNQIVRQRVRLKTMTQSILQTHLLPQCPVHDLFGPTGRAWLLTQELPNDERDAIARHLREYDRISEDLRCVERELARDVLTNIDARRLMTVPGIDMVVAIGILAAIGPITRFKRPEQVVAFLGLNPSVRQSGDKPARHGRITKQGPCHARTMLVEAAWQAIRSPGPLRAFYERIRGRRGAHVAAVATARKMIVLIWHLLTRQEDYAWVRPALHARKLRTLEICSGQPAQRGQRGATYDYNVKRIRDAERHQAEQAETAYRRHVDGWTRYGPTKTSASRKVSAAMPKEERI